MDADNEGPIALPPVSLAVRTPLYEQIGASVRDAVSSGRLQPGDVLPSFRRLARELRVAIITVRRAYEDLEHEGILCRRQGTGTFVAEDAVERCRAARADRAEGLLAASLAEAREAGLSDRAWLARARELVRDEGA